MSEYLPQIGLVILLVIINAAFAGSEMALVSLREGQLQRLETSPATGTVLAGLAREPNRFLATIQIGITLAGFLASAAAAVSLAVPLEEPLSFLGGAAGPVSIIAGHARAVLHHPGVRRTGAQAHRDAAGRALGAGHGPAAGRAVHDHPAGVWLLALSTDLVGAAHRRRPERAARGGHHRGDPRHGRGAADFPPSSGRSSAARSRSPTGSCARCWSRAVTVFVSRPRADRRARHCELIAGPVTPVRRWSRPAGPGQRHRLVHLRDLVGAGDGPVATLTPSPDLPGDRSGAPTPMRELRPRAADGHRGQRARRAWTASSPWRTWWRSSSARSTTRPTGTCSRCVGSPTAPACCPARSRSTTCDDIDFELPDEGDYATVAGLVLEHLGRIPSVGDTVTVTDWRIEVRSMDRHSITEVALDTVALPHLSTDTTEELS